MSQHLRNFQTWWWLSYHLHPSSHYPLERNLIASHCPCPHFQNKLQALSLLLGKTTSFSFPLYWFITYSCAHSGIYYLNKYLFNRQRFIESPEGFCSNQSDNVSFYRRILFVFLSPGGRLLNRLNESVLKLQQMLFISKCQHINLPHSSLKPLFYAKTFNRKAQILCLE